jgi:bacterioferritin
LPVSCVIHTIHAWYSDRAAFENVSWLGAQDEAPLVHAQQVGERITTLDAHPSMGVGKLLDSHQVHIGSMLRESLNTEAVAPAVYRELLDLVDARYVAFEGFAQQMIHAEELHAGEVDKKFLSPAGWLP